MKFDRNPVLMVLAAAALAGSLSACAPLMIGGAAVGTMMAYDRRTSGAQVEDEGIELHGASALREAFGDRAHINITSYNRQVLLTGEVPREQDKQTAQQAISRVENVKSVVNELAELAPRDVVAKATDDHTIGVMINGNMTIARLLNPAVPFDPLKDFAPLTLIGTSPLVLTAPVDAPGVPADARAFFSAARLAGDRWSYGTPGVGTVGHIGTELLKSRSGINPVHVPYPGYAQVATAMLGGHLQMALMPPALAQAQVRAGKLRAIGLTSAGRSALAPEVPSLAEAAGIEGFGLEIWNAFAAPATMPRPIQAKLAATLVDIARTPQVREKLFQQGWQVVATSPEGLTNRIQADTRMLGAVIAARGIKAE